MEVLCEDPRHVRISVNPVPLINGGEEALEEALKAVNTAADMMKAQKAPDSH